MLLLQTTSHRKDKWMLLMMQFKLMSIRTSRTAMTLMLQTLLLMLHKLLLTLLHVKHSRRCRPE